MLPMRDELMLGLAGADLLGFHTDQYVRHFLSAARRTLSSDEFATSLSAPSISCRIPRADESVGEAIDLRVGVGEKAMGAANRLKDATSFAHTAHVAAFPIGIAPERFLEEMRKGETQEAIRRLQEKFGGRRVLLGIDRLDPIKGIPHKLLAFERLLEDHPEYVGEVVLVQIAVPSRLDVALHRQLQQRLHVLVGRINGRFGTLGTVPIHYLDTSVSFADLVALYAASSAMVISSLRDGMNLVSFEWTVCQQHKPRPWNAGDAGREQGVLVLSEFAGAADHLEDGALLVNPYDTQTLADAMHTALSMPLSRRQALHKNAYEHVTTSTASTWAAKFVSALNRLHASNGLLPDASSNMAGLVVMLEQQPRIALLTDYDGTLTPIVSDPDVAVLGDEMRLQLRKIATLMPVAIVSGRSRGKIESFVRLPEVWVAGAHGFDISGPEGSGIIFRPAEEYREALRVAAAELRVVLATIPGALVEDNDFAVSVHYRNVADDDAAAVDAAVEGALVAQPTLQRFPGKMVVELRPKVEWNKGKAVEFILQQLELEAGGPIFPIYLGDDVSDEDAFAVLRQRGGLGILVSEGMAAMEQTAAAYRLSSPRAVLKLLTWLAAARATAAEAPVNAGQPPT
jgi:trehalose 6-phosphate synthase/phosphatase